jgi:excinuclease ABC subunit C
MTLLTDAPPLPERAASLLSKVRAEATNRPGIYRFFGGRGELLYVGKSVRVRARLLSYFRAEPEEKPAELVRMAAGVEWEYVPTEFEALLREFRLIRAFRPRFNVQHRRERRFAWVKISGGPAPRLSPTRAPAPDAHRTFGPFPARRDLPDALHRLAQLMQLRDCPAGTPMHFADQLDLLAEPRVPACPRGDLGTCLAPCAGRCTAREYAGRVRAAARFLDGGSDEPLDRLRALMEGAAERREYEMAARYRDSEESLRSLRDEVVSFREYLEGLTFVYRVPAEDEGRARGYLLRHGRVRLTFDEPAKGSSEARRLAASLRSLMAGTEPSPVALGVDEREELFLAARWFRARPEERERAEEVEAYIGGRLASSRSRSRRADSPPTPRRRSPRRRPKDSE